MKSLLYNKSVCGNALPIEQVYFKSLVLFVRGHYLTDLYYWPSSVQISVAACNTLSELCQTTQYAKGRSLIQKCVCYTVVFSDCTCIFIHILLLPGPFTFNCENLSVTQNYIYICVCVCVYVCMYKNTHRHRLSPTYDTADFTTTRTSDRDVIGSPRDWPVQCACLRDAVVSGPFVFVSVTIAK